VEDVVMLVEDITEPQAPAQDANLAKIILEGGAEDVSADRVVDDAMAPEIAALLCQPMIWPRVWPGL
jgi:hypothetical protein